MCVCVCVWVFYSFICTCICELQGRLAKWRRWSSCDVGELILQPFRHFTYVTTHSPILPSLYLHHSSFSNPSVASPTSQFILLSLFRFSYVTSSSLNSPGEPPMERNKVLDKWQVKIYAIWNPYGVECKASFVAFNTWAIFLKSRYF